MKNTIIEFTSIFRENVFWGSKYCNPIFKKWLASRLLFVIRDAALNLENSSTTWRYHRFGFSSCKSSDCVSLKESDFINAATCFEDGFQNF